MFSLTTQVDGVSEVLFKFKSLKDALTSFQSATDKISDYLKNFFQNEVYDSEGGVYGNVWAALSEPYATRKLSRYGSSTILIASGKMKDSYVTYSGPLYLLIQNEAQTDRGAYYAKFHQTGTNKMPQRLLMKMDEERKAKVIEMIKEELDNKIRDL